MIRVAMSAAVVACAASGAGASVIRAADISAVYTLGGANVASNFTNRGGPVNFNVYTGVTNAAGNLFLLESSTAPVRDDVVTLGNASEQINDYIPAAGGVQRFVTSSVGPGNQPGQSLITITVSGRDAAGAPADLWPSGFASGGNALTGGGFAIGLNLPALLGGSVPLVLTDNHVLQGTLEIVSDGASSGELLVPSVFFAPDASNWAGTVGITLNNGAVGASVQSDITLRLLVVPAPGAGALLGVAGLAVVRRRRR